MESIYEKTEAKDDDFITVSEVAHRYRTSEAMIYRWLSENQIPPSVVLRLGRKILINRKKLEEFESQK